MGQLNIHMTTKFENTLRRYMKRRGFHTKSEAIRTAVKEGLEQVTQKSTVADFTTWIGLGNAVPVNPHPRFASDDELWS